MHHPTRPPMASQARASARFSSLTTATTSTSMTDSSSYWASSQPKRHKYRSYASSAGNEGFGSPGTDMTSPGTSSEHKFGSGDEKGFPGFVLSTESSEGQSMQTTSDGDAVSMEERTGGLDRLLDEEIDRLSSVSSVSPRPVSAVPSLTSAGSSTGHLSNATCPTRRRDSSVSPSRTSRSPSTKSRATKNSANHQSRPPRRMTHSLYPSLSPSSEESHEEAAVISFASRQQWDDRLSTIREERKHSLSILEGHGRIASSDSAAATMIKGPPSEIAGDSARFPVATVGTYHNLLPSPAISSSTIATNTTSITKPLNIRSSPALRDRISMFEGRSTGSEAPSTPRSGYFAKRDVVCQNLGTPSAIDGVTDLFSPARPTMVSLDGASESVPIEPMENARHVRMPAEGAGSPWLAGQGMTPRSACNSSETGSMPAPWPVLRNNSVAGSTGLGLDGTIDMPPGLSSRSSLASLDHGQQTQSPGLSKRSSLTRTPTRTRNLAGQYDLTSAGDSSRRPSGPAGSNLSRGSTFMSSSPMRVNQESMRRSSRELHGLAPRRVSARDAENANPGAAIASPSRAYSPQYLNNKPLPSINGSSNVVPAFTTPPRAGTSSPYYRPEMRSSPVGGMPQMPTYSPYNRARTVTPTRPTLLSNSFGPSATGSILIPEFPSRGSDRRSPSFPAMTGKSPLSKSPLKDFMGALASVKDKVKLAGRKRAGTMETTFSNLLQVDHDGPSTYAMDHSLGDAERLGSSEREVTAAFGRTTVVRAPDSEAGPTRAANRSTLTFTDLSPVDGATRVSAAVYLQPTPCSSLSPWGDWNGATASLTTRTLWMDCLGERHKMDLSHCAEVRSVRREEASRKGLPPVAQTGDTDAHSWWEDVDRVEILELTFEDGNRIYFGVEGISGRLGWVTALWDAILACRTSPARCPPRSPTVSSDPAPKRYVSASSMAPPPISHVTAMASHATPVRTEAASSGSHHSWDIAQGVPLEQDVGTAAVDHEVGELSNNVRAMFDIGPNGSPLRTSTKSAWTLAPADDEQQHATEDEWIPAERQLSVFGVMEREGHGSVSLLADDVEADGVAAYDTSFDENDLNPSRSASQRRPRSPTVLAMNPTVSHGSLDREAAARVARHSTLSTVRPAPMNEQSKDILPSRPLPQPLTTAQLLPWKRAPKILTMPAPLGISNTDQPGQTQSFPSPHHFDGDLDGVFPLPRSVTPVEESDESGLLRYSAAPTEANEAHEISPIAHQAEEGPIGAQHQEETSIDGKEVRSDASGLHDRLSILHNDFAQRLGSIQGTMPTVTMQEANATALGHIAGGLDGFSMDLKGLRDSIALTQATIAATAGAEPLNLSEVYSKLDYIVSALKDRGGAETVERAGPGHDSDSVEEPPQTTAQVPPRSATVSSASATQPIAKLPGETSPDGGVDTAKQSQSVAAGVTDEMVNQLSEVLAAVKTLQTARETQDQQTSDMARYMGQLNGWLEKFVLNGTSEIQAMAGKVDRLTKELVPEAPSRDPLAPEGTPESVAPQGLPGLVQEIHNMGVQQQQRAEGEAVVAQRVDALIAMLGEDRQRAAQQQSTFESVLSVLENQRAEHELLLRALATDLTSEIRGEKGKFIEAMRDATSMNVNLHVEDFKKMLNQEVTKNMHELAAMREQKKALEMVISDLFAIKAKHTDGPPIARVAAAPAPPPASPPVTPARAPPKSPAPSNLGPRALPRAPGH